MNGHRLLAAAFACIAATGAGVLAATNACAHPHAPGDPFADVADTIVAGSPKLAPLRAGHQRWRMIAVDHGVETPLGTLEQRVRRDDSPAGRRWLVAMEERDTSNAIASRDSVWVTAGSPIPIYWCRVGGLDSLALAFDGRQLSGSWSHLGDPMAAGHEMEAAAFPRSLDPLLLSLLKLDPGAAVALALYDVDYEGEPMEYAVAIQAAGPTELDHRGKARKCLMYAVSGDPARGNRTVWIDRRSRAVLRDELRNGSGDLVMVVTAE